MSLLPPVPYETLGIPHNAETPEIRSAYIRLVRKCHPDKVTDPALKAEHLEEFLKVQKAYELLSNDGERYRYDYMAREMESKKAHDAQIQAARSHDREHRAGPSRFRNSVRAGRPREYCPHQVDETQKNHLHAERKTPGVLVVLGIFENKDMYAIPDTGTEYIIIARSLVDRLKIRSRIKKSGDTLQLRMANGRSTPVSGVIEATWCFGKDISQPWKILFHILEDSVYDLVLGNSFLMETQTMPHNKERLARIPRPTNALSVLQVNLLGVPSQRLRGTLENASALALPDSGSEPNLLSWKFTKIMGWERKINTADRRLLQIADGSASETEGSIIAIWEFWKKGTAKATRLAVGLHVLYECAYDLILGQDVLEETDAFLEHAIDFMYVNSNLPAAAMNLVLFVSKKNKKPSISASESAELNAELQRRATAVRAIKRLPAGFEREEARRHDDGVRRLFDRQHTSMTPLSVQRASPTSSGDARTPSTASKKSISPSVSDFIVGK
ncbi:hypothetical protein AB5N19_09825 [Seiridium cardinale]